MFPEKLLVKSNNSKVVVVFVSESAEVSLKILEKRQLMPWPGMGKGTLVALVLAELSSTFIWRHELIHRLNYC